MIIRIHPAAWWFVWDKPGSLPHDTWGAVWASLTSSMCGRTDPHRICSVKESSLETKSRLLPEIPAFLSTKSWMPQARSGARFNLKAGVAFHYCPLFCSGSLRAAGQSRAKHQSGFTEWLGASVHVTVVLPKPPLVWLGPLPALLPVEEDPAPEKEGEADLLVQRALVSAWTEHGKWATPAQGLLRSREIASAQGIWISDSCPCCLVAREASMLGSLPAEIKVSFLLLDKVKTFKKELRNPHSLAAREGTDHSDLCFQRLFLISSQKAVALYRGVTLAPSTNKGLEKDPTQSSMHFFLPCLWQNCPGWYLHAKYILCTLNLKQQRHASKVSMPSPESQQTVSRFHQAHCGCAWKGASLQGPLPFWGWFSSPYWKSPIWRGVL